MSPWDHILGNNRWLERSAAHIIFVLYRYVLMTAIPFYYAPRVLMCYYNKNSKNVYYGSYVN